METGKPASKGREQMGGKEMGRERKGRRRKRGEKERMGDPIPGWESEKVPTLLPVPVSLFWPKTNPPCSTVSLR